MTSLLLTKQNKAVTFLFSIIFIAGLVLNVLLTKGCSNNVPSDGYKLEHSARADIGVVTADTFKWENAKSSDYLLHDTTKLPTKIDSTKIQNDFIKKFNDTATFIKFSEWLYTKISAKDYDVFRNTTAPFYNAWLLEKYKEFIKPKK